MFRTLFSLALLLIAMPFAAQAKCYSWQTNCEIAKPAPGTSWKITDDRRQRVGDIYTPGHNRRLQIRDNHRRILGYIETDGTITNRHRQKIGGIEELTR
jgi:hypothetical protein